MDTGVQARAEPSAPRWAVGPGVSGVSASGLLADYARTRDTAVRDRLIVLHGRLVHSLAQRFVGHSEPFEDLVQVGTLGLIKALERFDPGRGSRFSTFAVPTIVGEIRRHLRDNASLLKTPRWLHDLRYAAGRASERFAREQGRAPTPAEIAAS